MKNEITNFLFVTNKFGFPFFIFLFNSDIIPFIYQVIAVSYLLQILQNIFILFIFINIVTNRWLHTYQQQIIASKPLPEHFKVWLAVGLNEETDDRDLDGIIDVLDDSQNVVKALEVKVQQSAKPKESYDFSVTTFADGEHNQESWKQMLPFFLQWAYPVDNEK